MEIGDLSSAGRASALQAEGHRFEPCRSHSTTYADVAQLAEQLICNQQVIGSSPIIGFYGWIPEWPKGTDCKSAATCFGGSNPPPSIFLLYKTINQIIFLLEYIMTRGGAVWKLAGLITRRSVVQIHLPQLRAQIAQLVEQRTENPRVVGSIPTLGIFFY